MINSDKKDIRLRLPRQEVHDGIQKQISEGEKFIGLPITDERAYKIAKEANKLWYDYTRDLLLKLFSTDRIQKEFSPSVIGLVPGFNFHSRVQEFYRDTDNHLNELRSILGRLELFEEYIKTDSVPQEKVIKSEKYSLPESKTNWKDIEKEFGITKIKFGKNINFVKDSLRRKIIFRDVEHSFILANLGYSKPAVILAGGVIEELLRLYLISKGIKPANDKFDEYIKACENKGLLKSAISRLSHSVREFRNLVHLSAEKTKNYAISKATAKGAVASIFTIANDF